MYLYIYACKYMVRVDELVGATASDSRKDSREATGNPPALAGGGVEGGGGGGGGGGAAEAEEEAEVLERVEALRGGIYALHDASMAVSRYLPRNDVAGAPA
jgi:hypothetical protein